ncbi:MAG: DUF3095 family protein [Elusimicrobiota bacterium]|nr:DUF3095 family protein [Elusimicrobiota bacterium]
MDDDRFYDDLPLFADFRAVTDDRAFRPLPKAWKVVVADVEGSTRFVEAGRYKDVNTVGAATIAAAQNAMGRRDFPFVFGGDGATLVVPPGALEPVLRALDGVRALARERHGMSLRLGVVGADELYAQGAAVEIGKYELFAGKVIASFRGGGLSKADELVKRDPARYAVPERDAHHCDLSGLSCRWKPIRSRRGVIVSILVGARPGRPAKPVFDKVLDRLDAVFGGDLRSANPVHPATMTYRSVWDNLAAERRLHASAFTPAFAARALEIVVAGLVFGWKVPALVFDAEAYAESMAAHSDFRKFDDTLRMVVDCSARQAADIRDFLAGLHAAGEVVYGLHESDEALMTCFVYDVKDGGHVHFIDGGNGGYTLAAKQLKAQLKAEK